MVDAFHLTTFFQLGVFTLIDVHVVETFLSVAIPDILV